MFIVTSSLSPYTLQIIRSKALPHIDIKTEENPFCAPYAAKARILIHTHLEHFRLRLDTLAVGESVFVSLL